MTWTLRLYDESGTEIAWVQKADVVDYSFSITHPDSGWEQLEESLRRGNELWPDNLDNDIFGSHRDTGYTWIIDPAPLDLPPKEHLERLKDRFLNTSAFPGVDSAELTDE